MKCDYCGKEINSFGHKVYEYKFYDPNSMCDHVDTLKVFACESEWCQEQTLCKYEYDDVREIKQ